MSTGLFVAGSKGNDNVRNSDGVYCTINTGAADDAIDRYGAKNVYINAGAGKGNDTIIRDDSYSSFLIKYSGGNDYINGFNSTSTLQIASG